MEAPLGSLRDGEVTTIFVIALGATAVWFLLFPPLRPTIVSLELARTTARVRRILGAWESHAMSKAAKRSVLTDLAWIPLYTVALAGLAILASRAAVAADAGETLPSAFAVLAYVALAAGALDYLENAGLWRLLGGHVAQPVPALTSLVSFLKWAAIFVIVSAGGLMLLGHGVRELCGWLKPG